MRRKLEAFLRIAFVAGFAWPVVRLWLGLGVRHRERLPRQGPAIVVANHNSHLDILTLLALFPLFSIPRVQSAAAADYFFKTRGLRWFSRYCVGVIPIARRTPTGSERTGPANDGNDDPDDPLAGCYRALEAGDILVLFPEGTRGEPDQMAELKSGIWRLAQRFPHVPVVPVYMHGLGKAMPKGAPIALPINVTVAVGKALRQTNDKSFFMNNLRKQFGWLKSALRLPIAEEA